MNGLPMKHVLTTLRRSWLIEQLNGHQGLFVLDLMRYERADDISVLSIDFSVLQLEKEK